MGNKKQRKHASKYRKILWRLLFGLLIILLLLLLFGFLQDLLQKMDILVRYINKQNIQIHNLENQVQQLQVHSNSVENVLTYQHDQIRNIQEHMRFNGNQIKVDLRPKVETPTSMYQQEDVKDIINNPVTIMSVVVTVLGELAKLLVPVMP